MQHIVGAEAIDADIANGTLPGYALYVPNIKKDGHDTGNQIATIYFGDRIAPGTGTPALLEHASILRLIEGVFGLGNLGQRDASANPITGIWTQK